MGAVKAGIYVRTDSETPIDVTVNETDKITVYGSQVQPLQQKAITYDLMITLDGEIIGVSTRTGDGLATETQMTTLTDKVSKETTLIDIHGHAASIDDKVAKETTLLNIDTNIGDIELKLEDKIAKESTLLSIDGKLSSGVHIESPILATVSGSVNVDSPLAVNVLTQPAIRALTAATDTVHVESPILATVSGSVNVDSPLAVNILTQPAIRALTGATDTVHVESPILATVSGSVNVDSPLAVNVLSIPAITGSVTVDSPLATNVLTLPAITGSVTVTPAAKLSMVTTADTQIKGTAGTVYAVLVSAIGVVAGDKVEIKNSTDNSGVALLTFVADAINGTWSFYPCVGVTFDTAIFSDETKSAGTFTVTILYE